MDWDMNTVILVPRSSNSIVQAMGVRVRVTVLLLLQRQEVVGSDTFKDVWGSRFLKRLDDGSDRDLVLLNE